MRGDTEWVLIDTETTGLKQPIWTLEGEEGVESNRRSEEWGVG
jgi:hypothetical protein